MSGMLFRSTRGGSVRGVSFTQALFSGWAPDGGLYLPETFPKVSKEEWKGMATLSYEELAKTFFKWFISEDEIPAADYENIFDGVFSSINHPDVLPIVSVGDYNILEMWHGPSGSLKDFSLGLVTRLIDYFVGKKKIKAVAIVGTLGDTGCAAIQSCLGRDNIRLVVLYPEKGASKMQQLSMTTVTSPYIKVWACECVSDEFDDDIKRIFEDRQFANDHHLLWLNSVNVGRVLSHAIFHIYVYLKHCPSIDHELTMYIPTGGLGNAAGGGIAQKMGLPIKMVMAVNENDTVYKFLAKGCIEKPLSVVHTHACAIDTCSIPNLERVLYLMVEGDGEMVKHLMEEYEAGKKILLPETMQSNSLLRAVHVDQDSAIQAARELWRDHSYMVCPHTAVALGAAVKDRQEAKYTEPAICYSTATSAKFPMFVKAVDDAAPLTKHPLVEGLENKTEHKLEMKQGQDWEAMLRKCIQELYEQD